MNEIQKWTEDLFRKYSEYQSNDKTSTDTSKLSGEQIALVEKSLNTAFLNPKFKMKHFVTSGQMTPYSTVRQWMLELKNMEENCETFEFTLKKCELDQKICRLSLERETDELERTKIEADLLKLVHDYDRNKRRLAQHYIEREQYIQLLEEYLSGPDGKTPDGKSWLEVFGNMDEENKWEKHYWTVRLARQAAMDLVAYGRIGSGNMDAITQLEPQQQQDTIALTHEVSLRLESLSNGLRNEVHSHLLKNDPQYAAQMTGKRPEDLNKIEFNINDLVPINETTPDVNSGNAPDQNDEDFLNVYRP